MANPTWFDYTDYMANKLLSLQAAEPDAGWTADKVAQAFSDAGFVGVEGAYDHFNQYGNTADENISPNDLFVPEQYYKFKAKDYFEHDSVSDVSDQEAAYVKTAIHDAGMSAWQHYIDYGTKEGINPSNAFDTQKYLEAKAAALNAQAGTTEWTADKVADAFAAAGMNALSHALQYSGTGDGEAAAVLDDSGAVVDAYKVDDKTSDDVHSTFTLTTGQDNIVGTSGDDVIEAPMQGAATPTLTPGDKIDGGAGTDTINVYGGDFDGVTMKSVEIVNDYIGNIDDISGQADVTNLNFMTKAGGNVTANLNQIVGYTGKQDVMTVEFAGADGSSDAATIALTDVNGTAAVTADDVETLTLSLTGTNYINSGGTKDITGNKLKSLILTGEGSLAQDKDGALALVDDAGDSLESIDAGSAKGGVALSLVDKTTAKTAFAFTGGAGADKLDLTAATHTITGATVLTIDMGAGDDTTTLTLAAMKDDSTIKGGEGTDTLVFTGNYDSGTAKLVSGFEAVKLNAAAAGATTFDASVDTNISSYAVIAGAGTAEITELANNQTVKVSGTGTGANDVTLLTTSKVADGSDSVMTVVLDNGKSTAAAGVTIHDLVVNTKKVIFDSEGTVTAGQSNTVILADKYSDGATDNDSIVDIAIKGSQAFMLTTDAKQLITKVDGSAAEGAMTLNLAANTVGANVYSGAAGDAVTFGANTKTDTIVLAAGSSLIANHDTVAGWNVGDDRLDISAFTTAAKAGLYDASANVNFSLTANTIAAGQAATIEITSGKESGFFGSGNDQRSVAFANSVGNGTVLFIDANQNGNWDAASDLAVVLVGVNAAAGGEIAAGGLVDIA